MTEHISETTLSEALIALRKQQPIPSPPIDVFVSRTPSPQPDIASVDERVTRVEGMVHDVRGNTLRLDVRMASLETTVDGLEKKIDKMIDRMDGRDRVIDKRFEDLKLWGDTWMASVKDLTELVKVSNPSIHLIGRVDSDID